MSAIKGRVPANTRGNPKHGGCGTLTYARWKSMIQRCYNPKAENYRYYGEVGITVCDSWRNSFAAFLADMGECPDKGMTVDREKNDVGYQPGNCRWATKAQQNGNRSSCVQLTHNGETKNVADWAAAIGISANTLRMRLRLGWTAERALTASGDARAKKAVEK